MEAIQKKAYVVPPPFGPTVPPRRAFVYRTRTDVPPQQQGRPHIVYDVLKPVQNDGVPVTDASPWLP